MSQQEQNDPLVLADGMEHAFVGLVHVFGRPPIACYDTAKIIRGLVRDGLTRDDAQEYFDCNIAGAWVGERTPCYLRRMSIEQAIEEQG